MQTIFIQKQQKPQLAIFVVCIIRYIQKILVWQKILHAINIQINHHALISYQQTSGIVCGNNNLRDSFIKFPEIDAYCPKNCILKNQNQNLSFTETIKTFLIRNFVDIF